MVAGADLGARLGSRIVSVAQRAREGSLARTTPGLTQQVVKVASAEAERRSRDMVNGLVEWLEEHASNSPLPGPIAGLVGVLFKQGGFVLQQAISTAIGFGVGGALTGVLEPYFTELQQAAWRSNPIAVLSPPELALAVLRGYMDQPAAEAEARSSGMDPDRFQTMIDNTGEPPGLEELLSLWRRDLITTEQLDHGIRQSRVRNEWIDTIHKLSVIPMSPEEALEALLEGQTDEAQARRLYAEGGGNPDQFTLRFNTRGQAPTPVQALEMLNRGIIGESGRGPDQTSYEQAFLEGPWRNKWLGSFEKLREYLPPPRSIPTLLKNGAITEQLALELFQKNGLTPELAADYVASALSDQSALDKPLTVSLIQLLYQDRAVSEQEAGQMLQGLGYHQANIRWLLAAADLAREKHYLDTYVGRVHTLYVNHRITDSEAQRMLDRERVPGDQKTYLLDLWDAERGANVPVLTVAQLQAALKAALLTEEAVRQELLSRGYPKGDVEVLIALAGPPSKAVATPKHLTAAQVTSALSKQVITTAEALADLELLGYSAEQAQTIIDTRLAGK